MSVQLSVALATARTLLNDDAAANWTDAALIPKAQQAHRELQIKLRRAAAPLMRGSYTETIAINGLAFVTPPADLIQPIRLFEKAPADPVTAWVLMTEYDPLPSNVAQGPTMTYWAFVEEAISFLGSTAQRMVMMQYWRYITEPTLNTSPIGFLNGEMYIAPRTAALAAGSVGQAAEMASLTAIADASITEIILSNRGRAPQNLGASIKP